MRYLLSQRINKVMDQIYNELIEGIIDGGTIGCEISFKSPESSEPLTYFLSGRHQGMYKWYGVDTTGVDALDIIEYFFKKLFRLSMTDLSQIVDEETLESECTYQGNQYKISGFRSCIVEETGLEDPSRSVVKILVASVRVEKPGMDQNVLEEIEEAIKSSILRPEQDGTRIISAAEGARLLKDELDSLNGSK